MDATAIGTMQRHLAQSAHQLPMRWLNVVQVESTEFWQEENGIGRWWLLLLLGEGGGGGRRQRRQMEAVEAVDHLRRKKKIDGFGWCNLDQNWMWTLHFNEPRQCPSRNQSINGRLPLSFSLFLPSAALLGVKFAHKIIYLPHSAPLSSLFPPSFLLPEPGQPSSRY